MQSGKQTDQQFKALDLVESADREDGFFTRVLVRILRKVFQKIRDIDDLGVIVMSPEHVPDLVPQAGGQQRKHVHPAVVLLEILDEPLVKAVILMELGDFQHTGSAVFGKKHIVLRACGDDNPALDAPDRVDDRTLFIPQNTDRAEAFPGKAVNVPSVQGGLPLFPVRDIPQQITHADPFIQRKGRSIRHVVNADDFDLIALGKQICHTADCFFNAAESQVQRDDTNLFQWCPPSLSPILTALRLHV